MCVIFCPVCEFNHGYDCPCGEISVEHCGCE